MRVVYRMEQLCSISADTNEILPTPRAPSPLPRPERLGRAGLPGAFCAPLQPCEHKVLALHTHVLSGLTSTFLVNCQLHLAPGGYRWARRATGDLVGLVGTCDIGSRPKQQRRRGLRTRAKRSDSGQQPPVPPQGPCLPFSCPFGSGSVGAKPRLPPSAPPQRFTPPDAPVGQALLGVACCNPSRFKTAPPLGAAL